MGASRKELCLHVLQPVRTRAARSRPSASASKQHAMAPENPETLRGDRAPGQTPPERNSPERFGSRRAGEQAQDSALSLRSPYGVSTPCPDPSTATAV